MQPAPDSMLEQRKQALYQTLNVLRETDGFLSLQETEDLLECVRKRMNTYFPEDWKLRLEVFHTAGIG